MTPESVVQSMCHRHGIPAAHGARFLPLVRKALEAPEPVRDRILKLIDVNLQQAAQGKADAEKVWVDLDHEVLVGVARVLHTWSPTDPMLDFGSTLGKPTPGLPE